MEEREVECEEGETEKRGEGRRHAGKSERKRSEREGKCEVKRKDEGETDEIKGKSRKISMRNGGKET